MKRDLTKLDDTLAKTLPGSRVASYASTGDKAFVSNDGHTTFAIVYPKPDPDSSFGDNPQAAKDVKAASPAPTVAGAPVHVTGFDALQQSTGGGDGPGSPAWRLCSAGWAR